MNCANGGCDRPAAVEAKIGMRESDWRPLCGPCATALRHWFPEQREPKQPAWVQRARERRLPAKWLAA